MDILGIGPLEFVFILLVALIVLGPKDMIKTGKTIGRALRAIVTSDTWRVVQQASREVRNLPNRLIREAGIDELQKQIPTASSIENELGLNEIGMSLQQSASADLSDWLTPPSPNPPGSPNAQSGGQASPQELVAGSEAIAEQDLSSEDPPGQDLAGEDTQPS
jgi:Sec-independent protein translocase protein TatA